jgi:hypothetical protein
MHQQGAGALVPASLTAASSEKRFFANESRPSLPDGESGQALGDALHGNRRDAQRLCLQSGAGGVDVVERRRHCLGIVSRLEHRGSQIGQKAGLAVEEVHDVGGGRSAVLLRGVIPFHELLPLVIGMGRATVTYRLRLCKLRHYLRSLACQRDERAESHGDGVCVPMSQGPGL